MARRELRQVTFEVEVTICDCIRCGASAPCTVVAVDNHGTSKTEVHNETYPSGWEPLRFQYLNATVCPDCVPYVQTGLAKAGVKGGW